MDMPLFLYKCSKNESLGWKQFHEIIILSRKFCNNFKKIFQKA